MNERIQPILSKSGNTLPLTILEPDTSPKGIVQINTGTCIPQKIYRKFAEFLTRNGYITITYDYSDAANFTSEVSHITWIKDMESVFDFVLQNYPDMKKYMVGHSSGGQFIGYINNCDRIDKIFLVAASNGYIKNLSLPMQMVMLVFWKLILPFSIWKYGYMNNKLFGTSGGFPKNIILELRSWCFQPDFFVPWYESKKVESYYYKISNPVKEYHLSDDVIANKKSCEYILNLYINAPRIFETLHARDFGLKKFGHRGFYHPDAENILWGKFLNELEK